MHLSVDVGEQFVKKEITRLTLKMTKAEIFRFASLSQNDNIDECHPERAMRVERVLMFRDFSVNARNDRRRDSSTTLRMTEGAG